MWVDPVGQGQERDSAVLLGSKVVPVFPVRGPHLQRSRPRSIRGPIPVNSNVCTGLRKLPSPSPTLIKKLVQSKQILTTSFIDCLRCNHKEHWEMTDTYQRTKSLWTRYSQLPGALRCGFHTGEKKQDSMTSYRKTAWFHKPFQPVLQITSVHGDSLNVPSEYSDAGYSLRTSPTKIRNLSRHRH